VAQVFPGSVAAIIGVPFVSGELNTAAAANAVSFATPLVNISDVWIQPRSVRIPVPASYPASGTPKGMVVVPGSF